MITGYFTKLVVPKVEAGQDIKATIGYYAKNPGALYWKTFLIAISGLEEVKREISATREIGEEGRSEKTYYVGKMPDREITITFILWGHDDAGYDWDWDDMRRWYEGLPTVATPLQVKYVTLTPTTPPTEPEFKDLTATYRRA